MVSKENNRVEETMSLWGHISELRRRLLYAVIALAVTTTASFWLASTFIEWLARPIGGLARLQAIEVTEGIGVYMRISLLGGFIISFPVILYQLLAFTFPGLKDTEKRWVVSMIPVATILFVGGVSFAYFVMLPAAIPFLTEFLGVQTIPRLSNYIDFVTNILFWIGLAFEFPLVVFALVKLKVVSVKMLAKQWRIAIVIIAILASVITPTPDPVNMALLMAPLFGLYLLSLLFALLAR